MSTSPVTHQTVRLAKGRHLSPRNGVCVMELASMLAGEPFSDRPDSVCPVIAAFLRTHNDRLDDPRRQDLYAYAARVVNTAGDPALNAARSRRCLSFAQDRLEERRARGLGRWLRPARLRPNPGIGADAVGVFAARAIGRIDDSAHRAALALVDQLITMGDPESAPARRPVAPRLVSAGD
jgi:hypothetical protein